MTVTLLLYFGTGILFGAEAANRFDEPVSQLGAFVIMAFLWPLVVFTVIIDIVRRG